MSHIDAYISRMLTLLFFVIVDGVHVSGLVFTAVFRRIPVKLEILAKFYNFVRNTLCNGTK